MCLGNTQNFRGQVKARGRSHLFAAVSTGAPRVTLSSHQLHLEGLLRGHDRSWRERGEPGLRPEEHTPVCLKTCRRGPGGKHCT